MVVVIILCDGKEVFVCYLLLGIDINKVYWFDMELYECVLVREVRVLGIFWF